MHKPLVLVTLLLGAACALEPVRITPQRPIAELLEEARRATPPLETGEKRAADLVEIVALDPTIRLDLRYAGTNNFLHTAVYQEARAFLQRPAAEALVRVHRALEADGYGLLIHDAYRPWYVTKVFWEATPAGQHGFVADPAQGSRHNRGCAVDLTLFELRSGKAVRMPSPFDEFSRRSSAGYRGGSASERRVRDLLRRRMEAEGFTIYPSEWWHYDYRDWATYPIGNMDFEALAPQPR